MFSTQFSAAGIVGVIALAPIVVNAQHIGSLSAEPGFQGTATSFTGTANAQDTNLIGAIRIVVNALLALVALIAVIMVIFGTITAATAGEDAAEQARNNIIFVSIGLVIILLSAVIVNFVIGLFA